MPLLEFFEDIQDSIDWIKKNHPEKYERQKQRIDNLERLCTELVEDLKEVPEPIPDDMEDEIEYARRKVG